ncbi:Asp23/Gls24 family envelope stress response protein [Eubacteriaceae bacterium ES3]|nr:Asp23/Gls24 family envelope stress response protein [Eubacteriaceae bacterium ES3]
MKINTESGYIDITKKAIADIAGNAAMECYGLVGMAHKRGKDGLIEILGGDQANKGVGIFIEDEQLIIDLYVIVEQAIKISVVAENIISNVKYNVEKQTSLKVKRINVNVVSVRV